MKRLILSIVILLVCAAAPAQGITPRWTAINGGMPGTFEVQLLASTENSIVVNLKVPGFYTHGVATPHGEAQVITVPHSVSTAHEGEPDLPMTGIPAMIGDKARMGVRVVEAKYMDFNGIEVAPSKGDLPRSIDPAEVQYSYAPCYSRDAFFPDINVELYEPYILRDFRGQNIAVYPFAYNPVGKTLRVYYDITVEMYKLDDNGINAMKARRGGTMKITSDFNGLYGRHFINYAASMPKYTPVDEEGDLLVICHDEFLDVMTDFVNWKRTRGVNTTIVPTSTTGSTYNEIKEYIANAYNENNNIACVLLVGDVARIPGIIYTAGSGFNSYSGKSDNIYGQIVGNDIYNDIFIGRFSATTTEQVATQVRKVITYERDLTTSDTWCQNGLGVSTTEGNNGHYGEDDYEHIELIRGKLLDYGYNNVYQDYYRVTGYPSSSVSTISEHINSGVGIITYCNHGTETSWQSHRPEYSVNHVKALTNDNKLPVVFSTACLNGKYGYQNGCFAEVWMRATNNSTGQPTGAVGTMMSYISQPWVPPMWAQDEFVDILVESHSDNIKRTWGGASINALLSIFDHYRTTDNAAKGTYQAWILYGDPSMMLRTRTPEAMTVSHAGVINPADTVYTVAITGGDGALATITDADHNIIGRATVSGDTAVFRFETLPTKGRELTLCVFGYNKETHLGSIIIHRQGDSHFVWQDGGNIVVCGEGELQVFDVMGRRLSFTQVDGLLTTTSRSLGISQSGLYLFNLGGGSQKLIVK